MGTRQSREASLIRAGWESEVYAAVKNKNLQALKDALVTPNPVSIEWKDTTESTALHLAARNNLGEFVDLLVGKNAKVNATNMHGYTPLMEACLGGHDDVAVKLVQADTNLDISATATGYKAVHMAADKKLFQTVQAISTKSRPAISAQALQQVTALHIAAANGHEAVATELLNNGAHVNAVNVKGCTPLMVAADHNQAGMIKVLANHKADLGLVNDDGLTARQIAINKNHTAVLEALTTSFYDPSAVADTTAASAAGSATTAGAATGAGTANTAGAASNANGFYVTPQIPQDPYSREPPTDQPMFKPLAVDAGVPPPQATGLYAKFAPLTANDQGAK